jgi:chromosomal replication initiator protein
VHVRKEVLPACPLRPSLLDSGRSRLADRKLVFTEDSEALLSESKIDMPDCQSSALKRLWSEFIAKIATILPEQGFRTWIEPIQPERFEDNILTVRVPSQFHYEWIDVHYSHHIRQLLCELTGQTIKLSYTVEPKTNGAPPQRRCTPIPERPPEQRESAPSTEESELSPRYVFENFVEGDGNSFARAACQAIGEAPGKTAWNPLLIYGGTGMGKTHLLQAIGNLALKLKKVRRVKYVSSEKYTQEFIHSVKNNRSTDFSALYRSTDLLLVDDIQFFASKNRTQTEFFHTFNSLHQSGKQIVLSSDRPPHELDDIDERLVSRFRSGLITEISPPDFETRVAILERRAEEEGAALPSEVGQCLANHITDNVRELEGALITLLARAAFYHREPTIELANQILCEKLGKVIGKPPIQRIQETVAQHFGFPVDTLVGKSRRREIALARMIAMSLALEATNLTLKEIGQCFGGRDHSTVIHARKTTQELREKDRVFKESYERLVKRISSGYVGE